MSHTIEPATSGRARCRGCGKAIAKDELRLGERLPNPFATEGEMTLWFHLWCGVYKRPEVFLAVAETDSPEVQNLDDMLAAARFGEGHRRVSRIDGVERSPTGRARCRSCRELIAKDAWRIRLVFLRIHDSVRSSNKGPRWTALHLVRQ